MIGPRCGTVLPSLMESALLILIFAIVAALVIFSFLRFLAGPVILVALVIFGWGWLSDNVHWGSNPTPAPVARQHQ